MFDVRFVSNLGDGTTRTVPVNDGATVGDLLRLCGGVDLEMDDFKVVVVDSYGNKTNKNLDDCLNPGDCVRLFPKKVEGAC